MRVVLRGVLRFLREADMLIFALCLISSIYGVLLISSSVRGGGNEVTVQIGAVVIGVVLFVVFSYLDIDLIADKSGLLFVLSMFFIATLFVWGVGEDVGRASWLRFMGLGIQPAEVVKLPFTIITAKMLVNYKVKKSLNNFVSLAKITFVSLMFFGMVFVASRDLGTMLMYLMIFLIILFIGGIKLKWFMLAGVLTGALAPLAWYNLLDEKHRERLMAPFFPELIDPTRQRILWQPDLSVSAISAGEFLGQGLGSGRITQSGQLPFQHTDFIFSVAGEELGFVGCALAITLLAALVIRCFYVGIKSNNTLGMLVCSGFGAMFGVQMISSVGMCLGLMPVIGITLPFFSYGGSSMVICFAAAGIVSGIKMRPKPIRFRTM